MQGKIVVVQFRLEVNVDLRLKRPNLRSAFLEDVQSFLTRNYHHKLSTAVFPFLTTKNKKGDLKVTICVKGFCISNTSNEPMRC